LPGKGRAFFAFLTKPGGGGAALGLPKPFVQSVYHLAVKATTRNCVRAKYGLFSTYCTRIHQLHMLVANKMRRFLLCSVGMIWGGSGCGLFNGKNIAMTALGWLFLQPAYSALNQNVL